MGKWQTILDAETERLRAEAAHQADWKRWGTYLPERQWGTVREDYSANGDSWRYFPYEQAAARAYRWGEDGLLGWCDRKCRLAFAVALWNGRDPMLKERLFGLTNPEGNHGEDVKELYYYLDATPTHSYCRGLYKYPLNEFPYALLREESARRGHHDPEFELLDTGIFDESHYVDVFIEYAKTSPNATAIRVRLANRSSQAADVTLLGQLIYRNTWHWGCAHDGCTPRPIMQWDDDIDGVRARDLSLGDFSFMADASASWQWLFTDNETNYQRLFQAENLGPFTKDAFHRYIVEGDLAAVNPARKGTKCAATRQVALAAGEEKAFHFFLSETVTLQEGRVPESWSSTFATCRAEADAFYEHHFPEIAAPEEKAIHRQAVASALWTKQFYHFSVYDWLHGDPETVAPPPERQQARNSEWQHVFCRDVLSMPDKWEYPWFAAWDSAFHMIPFTEIDPWFARDQLLLFLREWYLHPNGQLPAYEFNFSDVNPPVHAWACREVYRRLFREGEQDLDFLEQAFHKLLLNFTWWVNRKDPTGRNIFSGGFLGLDNIGPFDRSHPPSGMEELEQADGTAWMVFMCGVMLDMALELARYRPAYDGIASKFFEHFMMIADAMNHLGGSGLWEDDDGFYYDHYRCHDESKHLRIRSIVGLIPLFAVVHFETTTTHELSDFRKRSRWFLENRRDILQTISYQKAEDGSTDTLLAIPSRGRLERVLRYVFDEEEFLSPFGVRSLSKYHEREPFMMHLGGEDHQVAYLPAESDSWLFGGNSNWRGPIWFPANFLLVQSLREYHGFYGDRLKVELPTGSGVWMNLADAADELARRLLKLFLLEEHGRPCHGGSPLYHSDPHFRDLILFYEYFHADTGRGCGAAHQTGWTALAATLLSENSR